MFRFAIVGRVMRTVTTDADNPGVPIDLVELTFGGETYTVASFPGLFIEGQLIEMLPPVQISDIDFPIEVVPL